MPAAYEPFANADLPKPQAFMRLRFEHGQTHLCFSLAARLAMAFAPAWFQLNAQLLVLPFPGK